MLEEHHGNLGVILLGAGIGGFIAILVSLVVCYVKRWCCFAVSQSCVVFIVSDYLAVMFSVARSTQQM